MSRYEIIVDGATLTSGARWEAVRFKTILKAVDAAWPYIRDGKRVVLFDTYQSGRWDFWLCKNHGSLNGVEVVGIERLNDEG